MTSNTQLQQVLDYLKQFRTITQLEAINHFNCLRLSSIILHLRNVGCDIVTHCVPNNGTHACYEYRGIKL